MKLALTLLLIASPRWGYVRRTLAVPGRGRPRCGLDARAAAAQGLRERALSPDLVHPEPSPLLELPMMMHATTRRLIAWQISLGMASLGRLLIYVLPSSQYFLRSRCERFSRAVLSLKNRQFYKLTMAIASMY